jgi:hypothetical protein
VTRTPRRDSPGAGLIFRLALMRGPECLLAASAAEDSFCPKLWLRHSSPGKPCGAKAAQHSRWAEAVARRLVSQNHAVQSSAGRPLVPDSCDSRVVRNTDDYLMLVYASAAQTHGGIDRFGKLVRSRRPLVPGCLSSR